VGGWFPVTTVLSVALELCGRATDNDIAQMPLADIHGTSTTH